MRLFAVTVGSPAGLGTEPPTSRIFVRPEKIPYLDNRTLLPTPVGRGKRFPERRAEKQGHSWARGPSTELHQGRPQRLRMAGVLPEQAAVGPGQQTEGSPQEMCSCRGLLPCSQYFWTQKAGPASPTCPQACCACTRVPTFTVKGLSSPRLQPRPWGVLQYRHVAMYNHCRGQAGPASQASCNTGPALSSPC